MGDALASSKRSGKSTGLLLAAAPLLTHFVTRVMLIRLIRWPRRGKSAGSKSDERRHRNQSGHGDSDKDSLWREVDSNPFGPA